MNPLALCAMGGGMARRCGVILRRTPSERDL